MPAVAGPFNLGDVLVRVALQINERTAQVTAESAPMPQILDGVPLRLKLLNLTLENREFVLNPTSCSPMSITATVRSTAGATANVTSPFAVSGCKNLGFSPVAERLDRSALHQGRRDRREGQDRLPPGQAGEHLKRRISFPSELPVRLETLRKACPAATFEANPAGCPAASSVGTATVHTPILAQPLAGPCTSSPTAARSSPTS